MDQEFESWALARSHKIVMNEGLRLALSAQNLDKRAIVQNRHRLFDAICATLKEARSGAVLSG